jgi:cytochrome b pre-mRNA-processing protein 3
MFDVMIDDMDQSLREMGVGDLAVGRRVKAMARAFFGRAAAYEAGLSAADDDASEALIAALRRNLFGTVTVGDGQVAAMADYMCEVSARLGEQPGTELLAGVVLFGDAPAEVGGEDDV